MTEIVVDQEQVRWEESCPAALTGDVLWKLNAYRSALFLVHVATSDCDTIAAANAWAIADQLRRAAASVSANIGEGYSRSGRSDRIRFYDFALGSARECSSWYLAAQPHLSPHTIESRLTHLSRIRAMILGLIRATRARRGAPIFPR